MSNYQINRYFIIVYKMIDVVKDKAVGSKFINETCIKGFVSMDDRI